MNTAHPAPPAARPRRGQLAGWPLLALLALAVLAWTGWTGWQRLQVQAQRSASVATQRIEALEIRADSLRRDLRAQAQRLQQADATNRLLRDELLGIGQRAALLEDTVARLADPGRHGVQALRLDEVELLLGQGQHRLLLAGDLDGARRAYALAAGVLAGIDDAAYLGLRQALAQERAMLDALGADPKVHALGRLEAFAATLPSLPARVPRTAAGDAQRPWWQRAFARLVEIRPSDQALSVHPGDRAAGLAALDLELALARAAIERRDRAGYRAALARAGAWLPRLWPATAALQARRDELAALRELPLVLEAPTFGTTITQLRALRAAR